MILLTVIHVVISDGLAEKPIHTFVRICAIERATGLFQICSVRFIPFLEGSADELLSICRAVQTELILFEPGDEFAKLAVVWKDSIMRRK